MWSRDSAPNDSDSASVDLTLGLVDVGDSLDVSWFHVGGVEVWWVGLDWYSHDFFLSSLSSIFLLFLRTLVLFKWPILDPASCPVRSSYPSNLTIKRPDQPNPTRPNQPPLPINPAYLSEVCPCVLGSVDTLNLDQRLVRSRVPLSSLMSKDSTFAV